MHPFPVVITMDAAVWEDLLLIADEFFLMAHNDSRGKAKLHPAATGLGLASGLLGELLLYGHITVSAGQVTVMDRRPRLTRWRTPCSTS